METLNMNTASKRQIPVILDTDIGGDIDDTWALAMLLKSPELDLKLVSCCTGNTDYRARVTAKFLQVAGRTDVPVAMGPQENQGEQDQKLWVQGYQCSNYPGKVLPHAAQAIVDTIMNSPQPVTLIAIGPMTVVAQALAIEPKIAHKARLVAMGGNVRRLHEGCKTLVPEYNIKADVPASQRVFTAPWDITITPLDTCGRIRLDGENYFAVRDSPDTIARAVIDNYRPWFLAKNWEPYDFDKVTKSSILFDTVAVYLAYTDELLSMEDHRLLIHDDGLTAIDPAGKLVHCAIDWKDQAAFDKHLTQRLIA